MIFCGGYLPKASAYTLLSLKMPTEFKYWNNIKYLNINIIIRATT